MEWACSNVLLTLVSILVGTGDQISEDVVNYANEQASVIDKHE